MVDFEALAAEIDSYMCFKDSKDGIEYELHPEFYQAALEYGVRSFSGVIIENGQMICDTERPEVFAEWCADIRAIHKRIRAATAEICRQLRRMN